MEGYEVHKEGTKARPALIISSNNINCNISNKNITVVPLTTNISRIDIPTNVLFERTDGQRAIKCGEIVTIYKKQLLKYETTLSEEMMAKVDESIKLTLNLDGSSNSIVPENWNKAIPLIENVEECEEIEDEEYLEATEEIAPYEPVLNTISEEDREYVELMNCAVERSDKYIRWTPESEVLFMKLYKNYGLEPAMEKFQLSKQGVFCKVSKLRKKYPEFK
jgi:mRNA-degrading endonuclease toxin of MazEF toxin-antitoxin module